MSGLLLEFKNFESTMSGSPDVLGGAPTDSELMQMLRQQQDFNNALLLRMQAMEDARVTIASPPPAPQRATRQPGVRFEATPPAREQPDPAKCSDGDGDGDGEDGEG